MERSPKSRSNSGNMAQHIFSNDNSFERVRTNLENLKYDCIEKRRKMKQTQVTISKLMKEDDKRENRLKEKLYLVQDRRSLERTQIKKKLDDQMEKVENRILERKADMESKKILPSLKDSINQRKLQEELDCLRAAKREREKKELNEQNIEELLQQVEEDIENRRNGLNSQGQSNQQGDALFFNLTAPAAQLDKKLPQIQQNKRKGGKDKQRPQVNPFYNKSYWDKYMEAERNGEQNFRFPGIGIERTPLYELQQQQKDKAKKKKEMLKQLKKYFLCPKKKDKIDFEMIYERVKSITESSLQNLSLKTQDSLLGHMMENSVHSARLVWGKNFLKSKTQATENLENENIKNTSSLQVNELSIKSGEQGSVVSYFPTLQSPSSELGTQTQSRERSSNPNNESSSMNIGSEGSEFISKKQKKPVKFQFPSN